MQSLIVGTALDEGTWFIDRTINTTAKFDEYLQESFGKKSPALNSLIERAKKLYPASEVQGSPFKTAIDRLILYIGDAGMNCHARLLAEAYPGKTYNYQASLYGGGHYTDQFPSFYDPKNRMFRDLPERTKIGLASFQTYIISEVLTGNPNSNRNAGTIEWPAASGLEATGLNNVLDMKEAWGGPDGYALVTSRRLVKDRCDFWRDVQSETQQWVDKTA
jgi:carboxylesterase type B